MKPTLRVLTSSRAVKCTLCVMDLLIILDGILTNILVTHNIAREFNPFLEFWLIPTGWWVKIAGALICTVLLWDVYKHWPRLATISIYSLTALYTLIVLWNTAIYLRCRSDSFKIPHRRHNRQGAINRFSVMLT